MALPRPSRNSKNRSSVRFCAFTMNMVGSVQWDISLEPSSTFSGWISNFLVSKVAFCELCRLLLLVEVYPDCFSFKFIKVIRYDVGVDTAGSRDPHQNYLVGAKILILLASPWLDIVTGQFNSVNTFSLFELFILRSVLAAASVMVNWKSLHPLPFLVLLCVLNYLNRSWFWRSFFFYCLEVSWRYLR